MPLKTPEKWPVIADNDIIRGGLGLVTDKLNYAIIKDPGGLLGSTFAGYVPLGSQDPYPHYSVFRGQI